MLSFKLRYFKFMQTMQSKFLEQCFTITEVALLTSVIEFLRLKIIVPGTPVMNCQFLFVVIWIQGCSLQLVWNNHNTVHIHSLILIYIICLILLWCEFNENMGKAAFRLANFVTL